MAAITTFEQYQDLASRTATKHENEHVNFGMGLYGETGELVDLVKKFLFHSHPVPKDKIKKEAGDVLWYISQIMRKFDITFEDAFKMFKKDIDKIKYLLQSTVVDERKFDKLLMTISLNLPVWVGNITGEIGAYSDEEPIDQDFMKHNIENILRNLYYIITIAGLTIEEVAEANIEKLKKRYPNGFSSEDSVNRTE